MVTCLLVGDSPRLNGLGRCVEVAGGDGRVDVEGFGGGLAVRRVGVVVAEETCGGRTVKSGGPCASGSSSHGSFRGSAAASS